MYTSALVPVDGSNKGELALPYARFLVEHLRTPVELSGIVGLESFNTLEFTHRAHVADIAQKAETHSAKSYLKFVSGNFCSPCVTCSVNKGYARELVIEDAGADKTL